MKPHECFIVILKYGCILTYINRNIMAFSKNIQETRIFIAVFVSVYILIHLQFDV